MSEKLFYILFFSLIISKLYAQQDPQISHYMYNVLTYNPAYAGQSGQICFNALGHQQWKKFEGAPNTNFLTADMPLNIKGYQFGLGLLFINDQYGFVRDFRFYLPLAYRFDMGLSNISIGIAPGIYNEKINGSWKFPDQTENILNSTAPVTVFDLSAGIFMEYQNFSFGFSSTHINRPLFKFSPSDSSTFGGSIRLVNHFYLFGSYDWQTPNYLFDIIPSVLFKSDISTTQFDINLSVLYNKKLWAGVSYRNKESIVFLIGTSYFRNIKLGLSYDLLLSPIRRVSGGTFEAYIGYCFAIEKAANIQYFRNVKTL